MGRIDRRVALIWATRLGTLVVVVGLLEYLTTSGTIRPTVLPTPLQVVQMAVSLGRSGVLLRQTWVTLWILLISMALGTVIGIILAVILWRLPTISRTAEPLLSSLYAVPFLFLYPVALLIFGVNNRPIIVLATVHIVVPITLNTLVGLKSIPQTYYQVAAVFRLTPAQRIWRVVLPAAARYMLLGLQLGLIFGFGGIIAMEYLFASSGLGYQISLDYSLFQLKGMYAYVLVVWILALIFNYLRVLAFRGVRGR